MELPAADETISFADHVKPLFRESDRQSMRFAFDLWSHDDVTEHGKAILDRLEAGTMPCDGGLAGGADRRLQRWLDVPGDPGLLRTQPEERAPQAMKGGGPTGCP